MEPCTVLPARCLMKACLTPVAFLLEQSQSLWAATVRQSWLLSDLLITWTYKPFSGLWLVGSAGDTTPLVVAVVEGSGINLTLFGDDGMWAPWSATNLFLGLLHSYFYVGNSGSICASTSKLHPTMLHRHLVTSFWATFSLRRLPPGASCSCLGPTCPDTLTPWGPTWSRQRRAQGTEPASHHPEGEELIRMRRMMHDARTYHIPVDGRSQPLYLCILEEHERV